MRRLFVAFAALAAASLLWFLLPGGRALSQQIMQVVVTNFPEVQKVEGNVSVPSPTPHSQTFRQLGVTVPPVRREEITSLVEAEKPLITAGFTSVMLSLQGTVKGSLGQAGQVGAVLVPAEDAFERAFREQGLIQLPLEVLAVLARRDIDSFTGQQQLPIAFPGYKIYFYNSTDRSVEVNLYAYLTH